MRPWQRKAGLESKAAGALPSFTAFLPCGITPPLTACQYPAHSPRLIPSTLSHPGLISTCRVPKALLTSLISHEGPPNSDPSFVHVHMGSLSSWGVRSVHQTLCWTLTLIISNPHNKLTGSTGPISQMRKLRLSEVTSLVRGRSAIKQNSWNLNQIMSL